MDALAQFRNMPKEPKLWEKAEQEREDKEYSNWTMDLERAKRMLNQDLYWKKTEEVSDWKVQPDNSQEISQETWEKLEIKDNIYYPILEGLLNAEKIHLDTFNSLVEQLNNNWNDFSWFEFKEWEKDIVLPYIEQIKEIQENDWEWNLEEFLKDFPEIESKEKTWLEEDLYNKIWKNYIKIEDWERDKDYSTAIKTTANEIKNNFKNIPTDSVTYKKSLEKINSTNIEEQFEWLHSLYLLAVKIDWVSWSKMEKNKQAIEFINKQKESLKKQYSEIIWEYIKANKEWNEKRKEELKSSMEELLKQTEEIEWWIFGSLDKELETNEKIVDNITENK